MALLALPQIKHALRKYSGWKISTKSLKKSFHFQNFSVATKFVAEVGPIADSLNHHPGISVDYTDVTLTLSSHEEGGVTDKDIELVIAIESAHIQ